MEFNFEKFLTRSQSDCRSKPELAEKINHEVEAVLRINDSKTYIDRLRYKHQLELTKLALKCGSFVNEGKYNSEIQYLLDKLQD
jgi:hypothetical protein